MIPDLVVQLSLEYILREFPKTPRYRTLAAAALVNRSWLTSARASLYAEPFLCIETPRKHAFHTEKLLQTFENRRELLELVRSLVLHAKQSDLGLLDRILALFPRMSALTALSLFLHQEEADIVAPHLRELPALRHLALASAITKRLTQEVFALGDLRRLHLSASIGKHEKPPKFVLRHFTADVPVRPDTLFKLIGPAVASSSIASLMLTISPNSPPPDLSSLVSLKKLSFVDRVSAAKEGDKEEGVSMSLRDSEEYNAVRYMLETLKSARLLPALSSVAFLAAARDSKETWTDARYCSSAFFEALPHAMRQLDLIAAPVAFNLRKFCSFLEAGSRNLPEFRLLELHPALRLSRLVQDDFEERMRRRGVTVIWNGLPIPVPSGGQHAVLWE